MLQFDPLALMSGAIKKTRLSKTQIYDVFRFGVKKKVFDVVIIEIKTRI